MRGKTDADAVFGMIYAQAEDDFNRVETNYLNAMGRLAEAEGETAIYRDLRMKLFIDPEDLKAKYKREPGLAQGADERLGRRPELLPAHASRGEAARDHAVRAVDGAVVHRGQHRRRHRARQPGAARGVLRQEAGDDDRRVRAARAAPRSLRGSNGFAIAPANTTDGKALLLINPHTSFFFRSELQMTSDEGLNAYGAATWGQFFIYQGFNERVGWMHTSSGVDNIDEYLETIVKKGDGLCLQVRRRRAAGRRRRYHGAVQDRRRDGRARVHGLPHASRPGRPRSRTASG